MKHFISISLYVLLLLNLVLAFPINHESHDESQKEVNLVTFSLFATEMSGCDSTSACDLYVAIYSASATTDWQLLGKTSKRQEDENNPVWPEVFSLEYFPGTSQRWKFDLMDVDVAFDDLIASIEVKTDEYVNAPGNLYQLRVPENTGTLWIHRSR